jgi:NAD(P)H-flavin reductase/hemoglobin-like flavoprotein
MDRRNAPAAAAGRKEVGPLDVARLKTSFAHIAMHGDEVPLHFYADLFLKHPETRDMFPVSMQAQRNHLVDALVKVVASVDRADDLTAFLRDLGRDHRKFGALADHYAAVGASLLATFAHFSGDAWTPELEADWKGAYELIASVMIGAAHEDEQRHPAYWTGTVVSQERKAFDVSVLTVRTEPRLEYLPGQSVAVQSPRRPRLWRYYSLANAPRADGIVEFHVRLIDGGAVSMALTAGTAIGDELRLGPPVGVMRLHTASGRDILMVAGSTGLAPLKAILEQLTCLTMPMPPRVHLFFGARTPDGLYDLAALEKMAAEYPWLTVIPAVSDDRRFSGCTGMLADVVSRSGDWSGRDAYLAGPTEMVQDTASRLAAAGMPADHMHIEDFGWSEP